MRFPEFITAVIIATAVCAAPVRAETYATAAEITAAFVDHEIIITNKNGDSGRITFNENHQYVFTDQFSSFNGVYEISDGKICLSGGNSGEHCDMIIKEGSAFVLIDHDNRFSVTFPIP